MTRSEAITAHIARRIVRNRTRKHWATLHADALEEIMSNQTSAVTSSMNVSQPPSHERYAVQSDAARDAAAEGQQARTPGAAGSGVTAGMGAQQNSEVRPITVKYVGAKEFDGDRGGDTRTQAAPAVLPDNPGPREPKGQSKVMSGKLDSPAPQSFSGNLAD